MLDVKSKKPLSEIKVLTVIGIGTTVVGEIKSKGTIRVEGVVQGKLHSDECIIVHETGQVKAELVAAQVIVSGEVTGNIFAQERIEITAQARLIGDITAPRVAIAEGVVFEGKCSMKSPSGMTAATVEPENKLQPSAQQFLPGDSTDSLITE